MRNVNRLYKAVVILLAATIAGCASGPSFIKSSEAPKSAIRAAEEVGANKLPNASLYLQLAKEELEGARVLAKEGNKEQAVSLLTRAEADAELAITLSQEQSEKEESTKALERARQLRNDNQLSIERSKS
jgi:regulator of protease activity HflC (stomatin/prohibitin superfamily)